ncbi:MAG TPA: rhomboid family intramembrane serine protease [Chthoniobacteraceae bacterium]|jgi:membrane associated rhomboid family serine protease|nr:rhomboid family intramembrane serine protease [Chthoniobacteraceae bacterium]
MSTEITPTRRPQSLTMAIRSNATVLFGMLGLMWLVELVSLLPYIDPQAHGLQPRTVAGLWGLLTAPFLHANFYHLMANSVPFIVLGGIVLLGGRRIFWGVTLFVMLFGGLGVWCLARGGTNHIGASGLIFGYLGFLLARGIVERSVVWFLVSLAILISYGGLVWSVLPMRVAGGVSWQMHLSGIIAGIVAAKLMVGARKKVVATELAEPEPEARLGE